MSSRQFAVTKSGHLLQEVPNFEAPNYQTASKAPDFIHTSLINDSLHLATS